MKRTVLAGKALAYDFCVLVDQDGHGWDCFRETIGKLSGYAGKPR
jgi:hypothetical protein